MFLDLDKKNRDSIAAIDDEGKSISYGEIINFADQFYNVINKRTLIFILSENNVGSLAGYLAALSKNVVPLLLGSQTDKELLDILLKTYQPEYIWLPQKMVVEFNFQEIFNGYDFVLVKTNYTTFPLYEDLSLLLPTSGSTGSPKLVRHSYINVTESARNVATLFEIQSDDKAIAVLPMYYTMGLSVITSHLLAGATVLLIKANLTDGSFWKFIKEHRATSFTGVPYSFEVLSKLRFFRMDLPDLKIITQGGGKLNPELFKQFAEYAQQSNKKFIATYGQTEGTARMAYLPHELAVSKIGSIGKAVPNGNLSIQNVVGNEILEAGVQGEMVYKGANVTLGYAVSGEDLNKGDENLGVLKTGDIAQIDNEGYFYIVGRVSRFLKLYGFRIGLDEVEHMVKQQFSVECVCTGNDDKMLVYITNDSIHEAVSNYIVEKTSLFHKAFEVIFITEIPRNESGKVIYSSLQ